MFLKFGAITDDESTACFDELEAHCQKWLRRGVTDDEGAASDMHDRAITLAMQLAYEAGVVSAVWGVHREALEAALRLGLAAYDKATTLERLRQDRGGEG